MIDHIDCLDSATRNDNFDLHFAVESCTTAIIRAIFPCLIGIIHRFNGWRTLVTAACRCSRCACILLSGQGILYSTDNTVGAVGRSRHHIHIQCLSGNNFVNNTLGPVKESLIILGTEDIDCHNTFILNFHRNRDSPCKAGTTAFIKAICQIEVSLLGLLSFFCFLLFLFCISLGTLKGFRLLHLIDRCCITFQCHSDASHDRHCCQHWHIIAKSFPSFHFPSSSSIFL